MLFTLLILAGFNAYLLLAVSPGHFLQRLRIIDCVPCHAFWISFTQCFLLFYVYQELSVIVAAFPLAAVSVAFYRFLHS